MRNSRYISTCTAVLSLWIGVLVGGMSAQDLAASSAAPSASVEQVTVVQASAATNPLLPPVQRLPVVADLRLSGETDGEEPTGRFSVSAYSVAHSFPPLDRISRPGRTPLLTKRSCAVLCVFLC